MQVPSDSVLAVSTRTKQEAEREEQQQLKQLVLNYEEREEAAARQGTIKSWLSKDALFVYLKHLYIAAIEERARLRGQFRGKKILQMGGGGAGGGNSSSGW